MRAGFGELQRRGGAAAVAAGAGIIMLFWVLRLLSSSTYGGVSVIDEMISRRTDVPAPEIISGVTVSQTFVATDDDLTEVQIFLGTYMRVNTVPLLFTLSEGDGPALRTVRADPLAVYDNAFFPFIFDPIPDSRGKTYTATISSPAGRPGNAFTAWLGNCDCYPNGSLSISGTASPAQELAMRVDYQHSGVVVWRELVNRMSQYKPEIVKGAGLVLLGVVSTAFALAALSGVAVAPSEAGRGSTDKGTILWIAASAVVAVAVVLVTRAYSGI